MACRPLTWSEHCGSRFPHRHQPPVAVTRHTVRTTLVFTAMEMRYACGVAEKDDGSICVICRKPILPGEGRYRDDKGDAHSECYDRRKKHADTVDPRGQGK
jgi:hypothetical protein